MDRWWFSSRACHGCPALLLMHRLLGNHCFSVSHFPSVFSPSPIFLLPLLCSSFSIFLLTVQLSSISTVAISSCQLLPSVFMVNAQPWFSGLCFYSELCHELLEWPGTSPIPLVPHSWSCCLSGWVWCPSLWAVLQVTREHLITNTVAVSLCLFQLPAATADRTRHYFLIFLAVQKNYLSFFWRPWFLLCSEPSQHIKLGTCHVFSWKETFVPILILTVLPQSKRCPTQPLQPPYTFPTFPSQIE